MDVVVQTSDLSLDTGGVNIPSFSFRIVIASPSIAEASGGRYNPLYFLLNAEIQSPCRASSFTTKTLAEMNAIVNETMDLQFIPPFANILDGEYDCGLQALTIVEHVGGLPYPYSDILSGSTQTATNDDL